MSPYVDKLAGQKFRTDHEYSVLVVGTDDHC
jgi:hypothetical protein